MVKVLIYSSKEIYDTAPYEGRAEAHVIAYRKDALEYEVVKNTVKEYFGAYVTNSSLKRGIEQIERDEFKKELRASQAESKV